MPMECFGRQASGARHHGRKFWALALELQRERGQARAAPPPGGLTRWIARSVKFIRMDQTGNLFLIWERMSLKVKPGRCLSPQS